MWDEEIVERAREYLSSEGLKDAEKVYKLVKKLTERINEIEDEEKRDALLYSTLVYLSENVDVSPYRTIATLEIVKHSLIRKFMEFRDWLRERLMG